VIKEKKKTKECRRNRTINTKNLLIEKSNWATANCRDDSPFKSAGERGCWRKGGKGRGGIDERVLSQAKDNREEAKIAVFLNKHPRRTTQKPRKRKLKFKKIGKKLYQ